MKLTIVVENNIGKILDSNNKPMSYKDVAVLVTGNDRVVDSINLYDIIEIDYNNSLTKARGFKRIFDAIRKVGFKNNTKGTMTLEIKEVEKYTYSVFFFFKKTIFIDIKEKKYLINFNGNEITFKPIKA